MSADRIDPHAVLRELGVPSPTAVILLATNRDKGVWRVEDSGAAYALRVLRPGEHSTAGHEQLMMDSARSAGIPVPEVHATGIWNDRPVMLITWCPGRTLRDEILARPWAAWQLGVTCGRQLAALHRVAPPAEIAGVEWQSRFGAVDDPLRSRLAAVACAAPRLLHLDLHPTNIVVHDDEIVGIFDWTNACGGDPRADLARTWALLAASGGRGSTSRIAKRLLAVAWQRGYEAVAGKQDDMQLFRIWAVQGLLQVARSHALRYGRTVDLGRLERRVAVMRDRAGLPQVDSQPPGH